MLYQPSFLIPLTSWFVIGYNSVSGIAFVKVIEGVMINIVPVREVIVIVGVYSYSILMSMIRYIH